MTRLLRIKMAVAGVLGNVCAGCQRHLHWPWEDVTKHVQKFAARVGQIPPPTLQVGHPKGRHWSIRAVNSITRWNRYLDEALAGKVQAECGPCNRKHGGSLRYKKKDRTRQGAKRKTLKLDKPKHENCDCSSCLPGSY